MKLTKYFLYFLFLSLNLVSCSKDDDGFIFSLDPYEISESGGTLVIKPSNNGKVLAESVSSWVGDGSSGRTPATKLSDNSWETEWCSVECDETKIVVTAQPNLTGELRYITITVVDIKGGRSLIVNQPCK